jgi:phage head maturation protease
MPLEIRSIGAKELRVEQTADGRVLTGLIPYDSRSQDLGGFVEVIKPGAFNDALTAGADVLCCRDHDYTLLLGRTKSGTMQLSDSPDGLRYRVQLPNTSAGVDRAATLTGALSDSSATRTTGSRPAAGGFCVASSKSL